MRIYKVFEKFFLNLINKMWMLFIRIHEFKNIYKKRKIYKQVKLTKEQKHQIDVFYKENYSRKISYKWHRLYTSYTGKFDYRYIPEYIFSTKLDNNRLSVLPFENKALLNTLFENVSKYISIPKIIIKRINGSFFDENDNPLVLNKVIEILKMNYESFIIKISSDSNSGRGVQIVSIKDKNINLKELILSYANDYVITELVKQSPLLNKIYPNSVNTLRVITYLTENGYHVAPIVLRIGKNGSKIDNAHAGGIFISVSDKGLLGKEAFTEYQERYTKHPNTNVIFENYKLSNIDLLKNEIIKFHKIIPNIKFISWDIAINDKNTFSLLEVNLHNQAAWLSQMAHGKSLFGENTKEILRGIKK